MNINELPELLKNHPLVKSIIEVDEQERLDVRSRAIAEIARIDERYIKQREQFDNEIKKVENTITEIQASLRTAQIQMSKVMLQKRQAAIDADSLKGQLNDLLLRTSPPEILRFIDGMAARQNRLGAEPHYISIGKEDSDFFRGPDKTVIDTRGPAIKQAMEFCRAAIEEAREMQRLPISRDEINRRLKELWEGMPGIDVFSRIEQEGPDIRDLKYGDEWRKPSGWITRPLD